MLRHLTREGENALESPIVNDLYDLFNYPPFKRLQHYQQQNSEVLVFYMKVYKYVEEEFSRFSPIERLGIVQNIINDAQTRKAFIDLFNHGKPDKSKLIQ
jgi:hypothetical protein